MAYLVEVAGYEVCEIAGSFNSSLQLGAQRASAETWERGRSVRSRFMVGRMSLYQSQKRAMV